MAVRRTDLYLPANSEKFILKAPTLGADVITLDMEDAVPPAEKETARKMVRQHIKAMSVHGSEAWVRINAWDTGLTMDDLNAVVIDGLDGITLPKCSGADDVKRLDFIVTDLEEKSSDRIVYYFSMGNKCCAKRLLFKEYYVNFSHI